MSLIFFQAWVPVFAQEKTSSLPNVVLILADDFGYECVGANGGSSYKTPNLDALARGGIRFDRCYAMPLCTPSRVQLMTGRYNFRNYIRFGEFNFSEKTFAHHLKQAGYTTAIAGKWQLEGGTNGPHVAGFDQYCLWQITVDNKGSRYANPKIMENGKWLEGLEKRYGPDVFCEFLIKFIETNRSRPFLAYWPMVLTHAPFEPTPDSKEKSSKGDARFPDMVEYLDKNIGRLVAHLEKLKLRENTLILFAGDNGTGRGVRSVLHGQPFVGGKGTTTDAGTHVPLVANWPSRIPPGKTNQDLIDFSDFVPTLAAVARTKLPPETIIDGRSFLPQLMGEKGTPREWIFCHYEPRQGQNQKRSRFVQTHDWKLYDDDRLFDLRNDLGEQKPIRSAEESVLKVRSRLKAALEQYSRTPNAPPPPEGKK